MVRDNLESIGMLGFSEGPNSLSKRSEAADLLESLGEALEIVSTGIDGELVLLKTVHGLPITALHGISEFQEAYQQMRVVREAPYLHLDNREDVQLGYMPLAYLDMKPIDFIQKWEQIAHDIEPTDHSLAEYIRVPLQSYKQWVTDTRKITEVVQIFNGDESDPPDLLCQFIDRIQDALTKRPKTSVTIPMYIALADLISLVKSRGWIKMPDGSWSRI